MLNSEDFPDNDDLYKYWGVKAKLSRVARPDKGINSTLVPWGTSNFYKHHAVAHPDRERDRKNERIAKKLSLSTIEMENSKKVVIMFLLLSFVYFLC